MCAALLPSEERRGVAHRLELDFARGTALLVPLQLAAGAFWIFGLIASARADLAAVAGEYTRGSRGVSQAEVVAAYSGGSPAVFGVLNYALSPKGAVLGYVFLTGVVRGLNYAANGSAFADPLLALLFVVFGRVQRQARREVRLAELGPERPDRMIEDGEQRIVLSAREKPEWTSRTTIQIGERLYLLEGVADQRDGPRVALAYRLAPLPPGIIVRSLVVYEQPGQTKARPQPSPAPAAAPMQRTEAGPTKPTTVAPAAAPKRWRVDAGEEARLTPEGPTAAVIDSLGSLPLRPRSENEGARHRPIFPGTCVLLGGARFEVLEELPLETGFRYLLDPWPPEFIFRDAFEYGPALVRAAQREREHAVFSENAAIYSWAFLPLFGLLPEPRQIQACSRYDLDPKAATLAGAIFEGLLALGALLLFQRANPAIAIASIAPLTLALFGPALARGLASLAWGEVGGSALLGAAFDLTLSWTHATHRFDPMVLPVTREAFWARLSLPDRQKTDASGALVAYSVLPHLSWSKGKGRLQIGPDYWSVAVLAPTLQNGRLTYAYELQAEGEAEEGAPAPRPPDVRHYQKEVSNGIARQWDDLHRSAPWLPPLLPRVVQERAYRARGGAAAARRFTVITAAAEALLALWFFFGAGFFNFASGMLLVGEAGYRLWLTLNDEFAPSLFGWAIADYLPPERAAYTAHRDAERAALLVLRAAR